MVYQIVQNFIQDFIKHTPVDLTYREEQAKYMAAFLFLFYTNPQAFKEQPSKLMLEAGTGIGKTMGYLLAYNLVKNFPELLVPVPTSILTKSQYDDKAFLISDISQIDIPSDTAEMPKLVMPEVEKIFIIASSKVLQQQIENTVNMINMYNKAKGKPTLNFCKLIGRTNYVCSNNIEQLIKVIEKKEDSLFAKEPVNKEQILSVLRLLNEKQVSTVAEANSLIQQHITPSTVQNPITKSHIALIDAISNTLENLDIQPSLSPSGFRIDKNSTTALELSSDCSTCNKTSCSRKQDTIALSKSDVFIMNHYYFIHLFKNISQTRSAAKKKIEKEIDAFRKEFGCDPVADDEAKLISTLTRTKTDISPEAWVPYVQSAVQSMKELKEKAESPVYKQKVDSFVIDGAKIDWSKMMIVIDEAHSLPSALINATSTSVDIKNAYGVFNRIQMNFKKPDKADEQIINSYKSICKYVEKFAKAIDNMEFAISDVIQALKDGQTPTISLDNLNLSNFTTVYTEGDMLPTSPEKTLASLDTFINETYEAFMHAQKLRAYTTPLVAERTLTSNVKNLLIVTLMTMASLIRNYQQNLFVNDGMLPSTIDENELNKYKEKLKQYWETILQYPYNVQDKQLTMPSFSLELKCSAPPLTTNYILDRYLFGQWQDARALLTSATLIPCSKMALEERLKTLGIKLSSTVQFRMPSPFLKDRAKLVHFPGIPSINATETDHNKEWEQYIVDKIPSVAFETPGSALILSPKISLSQKIVSHLKTFKDIYEKKYDKRLIIVDNFATQSEILNIMEKYKNNKDVKLIFIRGQDGFQGLDIRGLTSVHILRLPYEHPKSAIGKIFEKKFIDLAFSKFTSNSQKSKEQILKSSHREVFCSYAFPHAVDIFVQQIGRLLRNPFDIGNIYVYDNRLLTFAEHLSKAQYPIILPRITSYGSKEYEQFVNKIEQEYQYHRQSDDTELLQENNRVKSSR